jgi:diadenosine tetraphosphate (Ap4A) HIT family hydrolase
MALKIVFDHIKDIYRNKYMTMHFNEFSEPIEYNTVLNPKLWDHDQLKPEVRGALMRIAQDFKQFVGIPFKVLDVIIAGGNANYNYTNKSDIDLHLIADYSTVSCDREVAELFDTKRLLYKRDYNVDIFGIPVELYVEDHREPAVSSSYSVLTSRWIKEPSKDMPRYDEKELSAMVDRWTSVIQTAMKTGDLHVCRKTVQLLRKYRQVGLQTEQGEFSIPNLVYKSLRNDDVLKGMITLIDNLHDNELSLK